jgi:hypothetical protein
MIMSSVKLCEKSFGRGFDSRRLHTISPIVGYNALIILIQSLYPFYWGRFGFDREKLA